MWNHLITNTRRTNITSPNNHPLTLPCTWQSLYCSCDLQLLLYKATPQPGAARRGQHLPPVSGAVYKNMTILLHTDAAGALCCYVFILFILPSALVWKACLSQTFVWCYQEAKCALNNNIVLHSWQVFTQDVNSEDGSVMLRCVCTLYFTLKLYLKLFSCSGENLIATHPPYVQNVGVWMKTFLSASGHAYVSDSSEQHKAPDQPVTWLFFETLKCTSRGWPETHPWSPTWLVFPLHIENRD